MIRALPPYSVIILTHSRPGYLDLLLDSLARQTHLAAEIVIVFNGKGQSEAILQEYDAVQAKYAARLPLLWFRKAEMNIPEAFNFAVSQCRHDWVSGISDDDIALPDRFERQLTTIVQRGIRLLASHANFINHDGALLQETNPTVRYYNHGASDPGVFSQIFFSNRIVSSTIVYSRRDLERVGGMRDDLLMVQDYDLLLRLFDPDLFYFDPTPTTLYRVHPSNLNSGPRVSATLIELASMMNRLEDDPNSIFYKLIHVDPVKTYEEWLTSPAQPYRQLAKLLDSRRAFSGRSQQNPQFVLVGEHEKLLFSVAQSIREPVVRKWQYDDVRNYAAQLQQRIDVLVSENQVNQPSVKQLETDGNRSWLKLLKQKVTKARQRLT